jgi:dCMP deaminase
MYKQNKMTKEEKIKQIDIHNLRLAWITAISRSKDPRTKVGAVVMTSDTRHISVGYNGFPAGVVENNELWSPDFKYEYVVHAEINALLNCPFDTQGAILYCTHKPCLECLKACINARINRIVYIERPNWEVKETEAYKACKKIYTGANSEIDLWETYNKLDVFPQEFSLDMVSVLPKLV